jgi:hypothetical protein
MKAFNPLVKFLVTVILVMPFLAMKAYALAPVESLVLGNFTEDYSENASDPLSYVFTKDILAKKNSSGEYKLDLASYRGFYEEGKNTANFCKEDHRIRYLHDWEKIQVERSTMALVQYIGLDLISRALPLYAKNLEYTREEYSNLVENLVGNYCSANLSVISKHELLNNFYLKFDKENNFTLPGTKGHPYFPDTIDEYVPPKKRAEQEFLYTVKLFQSLCSWSGSPNNPGLMVPILKNPMLMSFFARQMSNRSIGWKELGNTIYLKEDKNTVQVWCENLVCRKITSADFNNKFHFSIGGTNVYDDIERLYCEDFRNSDYKPKESDPRLAKIMKSISFDEEHFIASQFIALITGVPDFLLGVENFKEGDGAFRSSMDYAWDKWARVASSAFDGDLLFEEPLLLELIDRKFYLDNNSSQLKISFDVNLGEFDRINQRAGKVKTGFKINVPKSFLQFYHRSIKEVYYQIDPSEKKRLINRFKLQIANDVKAAREKFIIPPWKGDLEGIIANEITSQIMEKPEKYIDFNGAGNKEINVEINYGLFAMKYINYQFKAKRNQEKNGTVPAK